VRNFLRHRHKEASRGSTRFSDAVVFGALGVLRLRDVHLGPRPWAVGEVCRKAGCSSWARPVWWAGKGNRRLPVGPGLAPFLDSTTVWATSVVTVLPLQSRRFCWTDRT